MVANELGSVWFVGTPHSGAVTTFGSDATIRISLQNFTRPAGLRNPKWRRCLTAVFGESRTSLQTSCEKAF